MTSVILIYTYLLPLRNMKFFLLAEILAFLELILIKIDSLIDAWKKIRKISVRFYHTSYFLIPI